MFIVNGHRVTSPSYRVKEGDELSVRERSKSSPLFANIASQHEKYLAPGWMKADSGALKISVVGLPGSDDAEQAIDVRQVIEFYSRN